jgi:hypothetical protein
VVFLGGWCNSGRSFFAPLAERLAARHRVIRLDWRGHGDSGRSATDFGHDELADDAMAVFEMLDDPGRWRQGLDNLLAGWLADAPDEVAQEFSAANPWFSARRLNGVTHFPALEIPDATAAEIEHFLG